MMFKKPTLAEFNMSLCGDLIQQSKLKFFWGIVTMALLAILLTACANVARETPAAGAGDPTLDLESLQANTNLGILHADQIPNAFVGAVNERLFIAVALAEPDPSGEQRQVRVYLCDSDQVSVWLRGEMTGDAATLTVEDTRVELEMTGDSVSGSVVLASGPPHPFTAVPASGEAGLYRAEETFDYEGVAVVTVAGWIVLHDGRQRGGVDGEASDRDHRGEIDVLFIR
jgi:hypothetical protein